MSDKTINADELIERLTAAGETVLGLANEARTDTQFTRLHGKVDGISLALSYVQEMAK